MDKTIIIDDKNEPGDVLVHRLVGKMRSVHKSYGLWICSGNRGNISCDHKIRDLNLIPRYFQFYCISHMIKGEGYYWTPDGGWGDMEPGDCVIVSPGHVHSYGANDGIYVEDTVCFVGPVADCLRSNGILRNGVFKLGKARRLLPLVEMLIDPAVNSQINANISLQGVILDIYKNAASTEPENQYPYLKKLIEEIKDASDKWWTVNEMAEYCNLSEPQLRRVFHSYTGMAPKNYIDRLKIQQAAESLANSDEPIADIAEKFGYLDPFHFSRRFKQLQGISPSGYREQLQRGGR
jgi:AraC-like DNA-binding protein